METEREREILRELETDRQRETGRQTDTQTKRKEKRNKHYVIKQSILSNVFCLSTEVFFLTQVALAFCFGKAKQNI